ncbi:hypothetical protein [Fluviispira multicolorata]|uniref:Uncharacterized protein n=1 Tax=Fluviispira multicolorata TaxID=2654512 RepID=A0A833JDN0_9BACT|nr:hypothetical protein [Fluviispira multicolorata]KAB8028566.1 hypothetical protein GCL57_12645 [Fluviispira multicolorata]
MKVCILKSLKNKLRTTFLIGTSLLFTCFTSLSCQAQEMYTSEDDMRDIFVAGGYGALFGAMMGTAILPFLSNSPLDNLRIVAGGASIGFMMGSAYGIYGVSHSKKNSYFNYAPENEENYFYSMPPTIPGQGYNPAKRQENKQTAKASHTLPKAGALIVGEGSNIAFAVPAFWIGKNQFGIMVASLKF